MGGVVFLLGFWAVLGMMSAMLEGIPQGWKRLRMWWKDRQLWKENRAQMRRCYR